MILHTVSESPFNHFSLQHCLERLSDDDILLLINDAVIIGQSTTPYQQALLTLHKQGRLFLLEADLKSRGLDTSIGKVIDYNRFVELAVQCKSQIAW